MDYIQYIDVGETTKRCDHRQEPENAVVIWLRVIIPIQNTLIPECHNLLKPMLLIDVPIAYILISAHMLLTGTTRLCSFKIYDLLPLYRNHVLPINYLFKTRIWCKLSLYSSNCNNCMAFR